MLHLRKGQAGLGGRVQATAPGAKPFGRNALLDQEAATYPASVLARARCGPGVWSRSAMLAALQDVGRSIPAISNVSPVNHVAPPRVGGAQQSFTPATHGDLKGAQLSSSPFLQGQPFEIHVHLKSELNVDGTKMAENTSEVVAKHKAVA